ncbi:hypothetical protein CYY_007904 [Polysphondylium violaceum]|uniref:DNA mismatch repair proteins mutS family domain-containing protein n=1 Tax=Polysphondylium violaceum TaxID=133409 RepID=A0A8J4V1T5_9MYCE|nr:hypothetical protein CYY_007904 [Polysphondylium violaceum]
MNDFTEEFDIYNYLDDSWLDTKNNKNNSINKNRINSQKENRELDNDELEFIELEDILKSKPDNQSLKEKNEIEDYNLDEFVYSPLTIENNNKKEIVNNNNNIISTPGINNFKFKNPNTPLPKKITNLKTPKSLDSIIKSPTKKNVLNTEIKDNTQTIDKVLKKTPISSTINNNNMFNIIALTENKSREIGYSCYNQVTGEIEIGQFCDSQTYVHLYTKLYIHTPLICILPPIEQDSQMVKMIEQKFPRTKFQPFHRKQFNENVGELMIKQYSVPEKYISIEKISFKKYLAYGSFHALVKYLEGFHDVNFVNQCVNISFSGCERTMIIDGETIKNLELIRNNYDGSRKYTLLDSINKTKTAQGTRLLISNIVQPPNDLVTIKLRQDAIKELLSDETIFNSLVPVLSKIGDIDKILISFSQTKKKITSIKKAESLIKQFIEIKKIFEILPKIVDLLKSKENALLKSINRNLSKPIINQLLKENHRFINEKTPTLKVISSTKIVYSIKDGIEPLLDVCKKTFFETNDDINALSKHYQEVYKLSSLKIQYSTTRGHYFSLPCKNKSLFHLPDIFIKSTFANQKCTFTSEDLISLSRRNKEVFEEIILLSVQSIEKLVYTYRLSISDLFNISESISLLDYLMSLANYVVLSSDSVVCPEIYSSGPIGIQKGYHPVRLTQSMINRKTTFIPNDTLINQTSNFQLVHGPNMSGKSTYIQQVSLLTIMAHIGSFIPAEFAIIPIVDRLISRIGTSDNMQSNASTFMTEMKEISYILEFATEHSLVIVDELGRGTANLDGSSIAWSISERMAEIGCYTLFVTHYQELLKLAILYPNIRIYHFMVSRDENSLNYKYLLNEGVSDITRYGIDIAELAEIDQRVIDAARIIRNSLDDINNNDNSNNRDEIDYHPSRIEYQISITSSKSR